MKNRNRQKQPRATNSLLAQPASRSTAYTVCHSWLTSPWIILAVLLIGAVIRFWGITTRHYVDTDTTGHFMGGQVYRETLEWHHSGASKTVPLLDYLDRQMGCAAGQKFDNGKPLNLLIRAAVIFLVGKPSIIAHSILDILFALVAMGLMLRWCHRHLGPRIALLAGCLWIVSGPQFQCTGRGYDYSAMLLFGTLGWLAFMQRGQGHLYRHTFLAGLALGAGITYHYSFFNYFPLVVIFVLFFRNPAGVRGKLLEVALFAAGFAIFPVAVVGWYQWLTWATRTPWKWEILSPLFYQGNTFGDMRVGLQFLPNGWFLWHYLNGYLFMLFLFVGLVAIAILHVRQYRWRWSICDDPLFILNGVTAYGLLIWGIYQCIEARVQMPELAAWPVVAAIGVHYTTRIMSQRMLRGRALNAMQAALIALIMLEQWHHTAPLVRMGAGIRKAMTVMSAEGKTATGEGWYTGIWPCTTKIDNPIRPPAGLSEWEWVDDCLATNRYDYFYVDYSRVMTFIVTYPGAGHPLMLDTYDRLLAHAQPVWRFEHGAPIHARLENINLGWLRQWYDMDAWRTHNPQMTPYDPLVKRVPYFEVYRANDVMAAFHASRVHLLAQLLILQQRDPNQFRQIAPRLAGFIQYNATNSAVMQEAQRVAMEAH